MKDAIVITVKENMDSLHNSDENKIKEWKSTDISKICR